MECDKEPEKVSNAAAVRQHLKWATDRRAKIQKLLMQLHCFEIEYEGFRDSIDEDNWYQFGRMTAAAFSLWRSCFLTENVKGTRGRICEHRKAFTGKLVRENAINFSDDRVLNEYSSEYYNHNARFRLERMFIRCRAYQDIPELRFVYDLRNKDVDETIEQSYLWDIYFDALDASFKRFLKLWKQSGKARVLKKRRGLPA